MAYAIVQDLYNTYGKDNVNAWADLDNKGDPLVIAERIAWAIQVATDFVNSRLSGGKYSLPFDFVDDEAVPTMIRYITALRAGVILYDGRLIIDADKSDQVGRQRKDSEEYLKQILRGQLLLYGYNQSASNAPVVVSGNERILDPLLYDSCGCRYRDPRYNY